MSATDERWMALALSLGRRAMGQTWPNPAVGCVIVNNGRLVGRGWTAKGGRPHAETEALAMAKGAARGATAYVTLEPCAHHGQTGPCATALVNAGVSRVVSALEDPDPRVSNGGHQILRDHGIAVTTGCLSDQARRDHAGFLRRLSDRRPFVSLKLATSFDGRIATSQGESQWITGPQSRRAVHLMRHQYDAVMVGSGTVLADDPTLNVRGLGITDQPLRVVLDSQARTPLGANLVKTAREIPLWILHGGSAPSGNIQALEKAGARCFQIADGGEGLDLVDAMRVLADEGLTRVFCEGGGQLAASLLAADLVDQLIGFSAGLVLGAGGLPAVGPLPEAALSTFPRFALCEARQVGRDMLHIWQKG